eukprot:TRINITY_DN29715_c2_g1_i1.p1 TRINITY_DN29715_c2_g1~~TRINITY_DN29715_c2_g1_i1.p1  ORF type:complete len:106 (-),score=9.50 TRINITY_DN29715_c2_g1_i1:943-1260(-)
MQGLWNHASASETSFCSAIPFVWTSGLTFYTIFRKKEVETFFIIITTNCTNICMKLIFFSSILWNTWNIEGNSCPLFNKYNKIIHFASSINDELRCPFDAIGRAP